MRVDVKNVLRHDNQVAEFANLIGNRKVVSVSGDGGFGQYMGEMTTAVKYGMDITHVLLNNFELGKISKEQRDGEWKVVHRHGDALAADSGAVVGRLTRALAE